MSGIHFFQRYSQKENMVTNNTLLLLSRLYEYSPTKFQGFLNAVLGDDPQIQVGVAFEQQKRTGKSVLDGLIAQRSFRIVIETKLYENLDLDQLRRHLYEFATEGRRRAEKEFLVSLSPEVAASGFRNQVESVVAGFNQDKQANVKYVPITFEQLIEAYEQQIRDVDTDVADIVGEFKQFCIESSLLPAARYTMKVVGCGWTHADNVQLRIYYEPAARPSSQYRYLGLYWDKCVRAVGEVENVVSAKLVDARLVFPDDSQDATPDERERIMEAIKNAKAKNGWEIAAGEYFRFVFVKRFFDTEFCKDTPGGLRGTRYFDLRGVLGLRELPEADKIAEALKRCHWK